MTERDRFVTPAGIDGYFYPVSHKYRIDGVDGWASNVSALAKQLWNERIHQAAVRRALRGDDPNAHKEKRGREGSKAHAILEEMIAGTIPPSDGWARGGWEWFQDTEPVILQRETIVASRQYGYAGTFDLLARVDGRVGRFDYKTRETWKSYGNEPAGMPYESELWQLALYELAAHECGHPTSDYQAIIALGPEGQYRVTESWLHPKAVIPLLDVRSMLQETARGRAKYVKSLMEQVA